MGAKDNEKKRTIGTHDERKRPSGVHATKMGPEDFQLHVHSDHGTGGHWCAKIFFFFLFVILLGLICLIIIENRDLEDLDKPFSESRYAEILEGWIDDDLETHDNLNGKNQIHDINDQHEDEGFEDNEVIEDEAEDQIDDETEDQNEDKQHSIENRDDHTVEIEDNDDDLGVEIDLPPDSHIIETKKLNLKEVEIADPLEDETVEEIKIDSTKDDSSDESIENSPFAVRIVVGLALVIVAHQVLLKRSRTNDDDVDQNQDPKTIEENEIIGMKRRLTLVTAEEPIPLNEDDMKQHPPIIEDIPSIEGTEFFVTTHPSTEEGIKDTISEEESFEDDPASDEMAMNEEKDLGSEEDISSEEIYSDEEINNYESSETSDIDDSDLLKRLDEKYGKLAQHSDTDDIDNDPTWTKIDHSGSPTALTDDSNVESDLTLDQILQEPQNH